uniref:Uncharacterized protein n=2 Tax=Meloidogyne incognita group TaxID=654580 RepID=A0A914KI76_MELIC
MMSSMPQLSNDILQIISEKLLFKKPPDDKMFNQMDLRSLNAYTLFMYHSAKNMRSFLSNFTKMKRLELLNSGDNFRINLYKDESLPFNMINSNDFTGPYSVSKQLILDLLCAGLLRISFIRISHALEELPDEILKHLINPKALDTKLCPSTSNLSISKVEVDESAATFQKHLITLLSINAENVEFCSFWENLIFECSSSKVPPIVIERTKKILTKCSLDMESTNNFRDNFKSYIQFLLLCCSNLEYLEFECTSNSTSPNDYITNLEALIISIIEDLKHQHRGSKNLKIRIEFTANFEEVLFESISNEHKILTLGNSFVIDELSDDSPYIARSIKFNDSIGRQHECLFQIFSEKPDLSDYYITNYDYDGDYDNYGDSDHTEDYDEYDFDEYEY